MNPKEKEDLICYCRFLEKEIDILDSKLKGADHNMGEIYWYLNDIKKILMGVEDGQGKS